MQGPPRSNRFSFALGRKRDMPYNQGKSRPSPAHRETSLSAHRSSYFLAALLAAGVFTFLFSMIKRDRILVPAPYSRPAGGERDGEFELFIGS